jgi:hypothetical protein
MKAQAQRICPLFGRQDPRVQIQPGKNGRGVGNLIVKLIQAERPDWPEEDRASRDGWESVAAICCVIRIFKELRNKQRLGKCSTPRFASQAVSNIVWLDIERYSIPIRRSVATAGAQ